VNDGNSPPENARLVDLAKSGNFNALHDLFALHKDAILRYCRGCGLDASEAHDVAHDVFLKIHDNVVSLDDAASFRPWVLSITRNLILNGRRNSHLVFGEPPDAESPDEDPLAKVIRQDTAEALWSCIEMLEPTSRALLLLRIEQELSYREIAALSGLTEEAVRTRLYRARKAVIDGFHRQGRKKP
jgi:RNA polymerase sigma-70 factor, ECF subfamily